MELSLIQAMKRAGVVNPVIVLDEVDKMAMDFRGDPASALLEVLDPEQNKGFVDHFLDLEYDLSHTMFIATANHMDGIPYPLFDRMEIISLAGYTTPEKLEIARKFLVPKNLKEYSLTTTQFKISVDILGLIINDYTKEAGVRQLERVIAKTMRKGIQILLKDKTIKSITVTPELLREWLGHPIFKRQQMVTEEKIGLATGLAWTEMGGDVLETEVSIVPGKGTLTLTGQLGEVMQESAQAALSYIRSKTSELNISSKFNSTKDMHIHFPEGATPKDGPSAGITMCAALVSALTKNPIKPHVAMTGEITLRGRVIGIGGVKEKLLAAKQHGMKLVIVPKENEDDVKEAVKDLGKAFDCEIAFVSTMDEVLKLVLKNNPFDHKKVRAVLQPPKKTATKKTRKKVS